MKFEIEGNKFGKLDLPLSIEISPLTVIYGKTADEKSELLRSIFIAKNYEWLYRTISQEYVTTHSTLQALFDELPSGWENLNLYDGDYKKTIYSDPAKVPNLHNHPEITHTTKLGHDIFLPSERIAYFKLYAKHNLPDNKTSMPAGARSFIRFLDYLRTYYTNIHKYDEEKLGVIAILEKSLGGKLSYKNSHLYKWVWNEQSNENRLTNSGQIAPWLIVYAGILLLYFKDSKENLPFLFIDEPELHIDKNLLYYIVGILSNFAEQGIGIVISTKSRALLSAVSYLKNAKVYRIAGKYVKYQPL